MQSVGRTPTGEILEGLYSMGEPPHLSRVRMCGRREAKMKHHEQHLLLILLWCTFDLFRLW